MKKVILVALVLSVFALAFSVIVAAGNPIGEAPSPGATSAPSPSAGPPDGASPDAEYVYQDDDVPVRLLNAGTVTTLPMSQYLVGVVAAEMPATFGDEALKAQAVAARTETLYHILEYKSPTHPDADVCSDPADCQAYKTDDELRAKWGADYDAYIKKIAAAVQATDGECLVYAGEPIQAVFHSSSAGQTANSGEVWQSSLPYLTSVKSPESSSNVPNYVSTVVVSLSDFKSTVLNYYPKAVFPKDESQWVTDITQSPSGRLSTLKLGGVTVSGTSLRAMFGLRSTAASISVDDQNVTFTTTGYGHGVGMSQYGANTFAAEGKSYRDILTWYYTGVQFAEEKTFFSK
ncbi:stage II sporulation protein D [Sporobacter termitidis DSM 10068]|uniref:Stage II sporulation protein D n=1 Tax=Sporobacter termitidis DSM 10068 TaxID=1123282 RepID=A0A1M5U7P3_9FIRM|nr:stage II sporulation protein D [Sporobacter termitidis]SHH58921.1 stage II sporulation protein D [Sporobacter termitidis DSM 10068]